VLLNATTKRDAHGNVVGVVGVGQDITASKKAHLQAKRVAADLTSLINTANAPIFGIDKQGLVNEWNEKAAQITGYTKQEVMGRHLISHFISTEYQQSVQAVLDNALAGIPSSNFEFQLHTKKGARVDVLLNATPRRDEQDQIYGVVGVGQDITDRKATEFDLQQAAKDLLRLNEDLKNRSMELEQKNQALSEFDKIKDEFLANTSHELKTPLNGIVGLADALLSGACGDLPPKSAEGVRTIMLSGKRLASLVDDILDLSKLKTNGQGATTQLVQEVVDMRILVEDVLAICLPLAKKKLKAENLIPSDFLKAWGDPRRLQQILINLVSNSLKFTEQGKVQISAQVTEGARLLAVTVADNGIGISPENQKIIFESFKQADASISSKYGGSGLGLTVTKKLVELHGGEIFVRSTPGKGSKFTFTIPTATENQLSKAMLVSDDRHQLASGQPSDKGASAADGPSGPIKAHDSVAARKWISRFQLDVQSEILSDLAGTDDLITTDNLTILSVDDNAVNQMVVESCLVRLGHTVVRLMSGQECLNWLEQNGMDNVDAILMDVIPPSPHKHTHSHSHSHSHTRAVPRDSSTGT
jgi:PAS domain S-box-containing protein